MTSPAVLGVVLRHPVLFRITRGLFGCLVGGAVFWWVAAHAGGTHGTVIVHPVLAPTDVTVGDRTYRVERLDGEPIVCELPAGEYTFHVRRGHETLLRETFTVQRGGTTVLWGGWGGHSTSPSRRVGPSATPSSL